jgi:hypothetical protein
MKLKMKRKTGKLKRSFFPIMFITLFMSCGRNHELIFIPVGERIHHDDFEYSVTNYKISRFLRKGADTLKAQGMFYLVCFRVDNRALRVGHKWDNNIAFVADGKGGRYENVTGVQLFLNKVSPFSYREQYNTAAGSSDSTMLAFDIPFTVTRPFLMVKGETLMGDIFDRNKFRRTAIKLF